MLHSDFDLYTDFYELSIIVQNSIIENLINQTDFQVSNENIAKLNYEIELGRVNFLIESLVKAAKPKKVIKPRAKKVIKKDAKKDSEEEEELVLDI